MKSSAGRQHAFDAGARTSRSAPRAARIAAYNRCRGRRIAWVDWRSGAFWAISTAASHDARSERSTEHRLESSGKDCATSPISLIVLVSSSLPAWHWRSPPLIGRPVPPTELLPPGLERTAKRSQVHQPRDIPGRRKAGECVGIVVHTLPRRSAFPLIDCRSNAIQLGIQVMRRDSPRRFPTATRR